MKKHMIAFVGALLLMMGLFTVATATDGSEIVASGYCGADGGNMTWTLDSEGTFTISGNGEMVNYSFSYSYMEGIKFTIPWYSNRSNIKTVIIGDGVTSIGNYTFYNCYNLTSATISNSVTSIGRAGFAGCKSLTSMVIPNSVAFIGVGAFNECENLKNVTIPNGVTSIENDVFNSCYNLTNVTIPNGVTDIGDDAFIRCTSLTRVTIPNSVTSIGEYAFSDCHNLTSVAIGNSVKYIHTGAFEHCMNLSNVYYAGTELQWDEIMLGPYNSPIQRATIHYNSANTQEPALQFEDVPVSAYFYDSVVWAVNNGITNGTTSVAFSPHTTCSTAHIITFLWRAFGSPEPTASKTFSDVKDSDYFAKAAAWAYENGLVSEDDFNPETPCTRSKTVFYLWKLAGEPYVVGVGFSDVPPDADYVQAISWAVNRGITNGTTATTFSPESICTRAHVVTFLWRSMTQ